jgi:hypothetical protein
MRFVEQTNKIHRQFIVTSSAGDSIAAGFGANWFYNFPQLLEASMHDASSVIWLAAPGPTLGRNWLFPNRFLIKKRRRHDSDRSP